MATFKITSGLPLPPFTLSSVNGAGPAFTADTAAADTLNVGEDAFLISSSSQGAILGNTGAWTVNVGGLIQSRDYAIYTVGKNLTVNVALGGSIVSTAADATIAQDAEFSSTSTFALNNKGTIQAGGLTLGALYAVVTTARTVTITNSGTIKGNIVSADGIGNDTLTNSGFIFGDVDLEGGTNKVTNSGYLTGAARLGDGTDTVINSGSLLAGVDGQNGKNTLTNSGEIGLLSGFDNTSYSGGTGDDSITNSLTGQLFGMVRMGLGKNSLNNAGQIGANEGVSYAAAGTAADTVTNSGQLEGAVIIGNGVNTLTNSGSIGVDSANISVHGGDDESPGIGLPVILNSDLITNKGTLLGAVELRNGKNTLNNTGRVGVNTSDENSYVGMAGNDTVSNGLGAVLLGGVAVGSGDNSLTNAGSIGASNSEHSYSTSGLSKGDKVTNSGTMSGSIYLGSGINAVTNSGSVGAGSIGVSIWGGNDEDPGGGAALILNTDTVTNTKTLLGSIYLDDGKNVVTNSGTVGQNISGYAYQGGRGIDTVSNTGILDGAVDLGTDETANNTVVLNLLTNSGTIDGDVYGGQQGDKIDNKASAKGGILGDVHMGDGLNTLTNAGLIQGNVYGGNWIDKVTNTGTISGIVDLFEGDDTYTGGNFVDRVWDEMGKDTFTLGAGNDGLFATFSGGGDNALDRFDGGLGIDIYDASYVPFGVAVNIGTAAFSGYAETGYVPAAIAANTSFVSIDLINMETEKVFNFENVAGSDAADIIIGSSIGNTLQGRAGADEIYGLAGNDQIEGGSGADQIIGGLGADTLYGGVDGDTFYYMSVAESGPTALTRDSIMDFEVGVAGGDVINLSHLDADTRTTATGDQAFTFIGTNVVWGGVAGQLRAVWRADGQVIEGDTNGDRIADFSIFIKETGAHATLSATNGVDFVL